MDRLSQIHTFCRISQVSRETVKILEQYEDMLIEANKKLNLIGKTTIKNIWDRHFLDSIQVIDFVDKNDETLIDLGSGAGFPGLVVAIAALEKKIPIKIKLIEKSPKKIQFLNQVIKKLKLDVRAVLQNVEERNYKLDGDVLVARAFKPLPVIFELINNKAKNFKKIIIFLGKTGHEKVLQASKIWDIEYKQRESITSSDSIIIEVNNLKKR